MAATLGRIFAATALAALTSALAWSSAAWGANWPLSEGQTRLELNHGIVAALRQESVAIKPIGPARLRGRKLTLPVTSGTFDQEAGTAAFAVAGGFRLIAGGKAVALRRLKFDSSARSLSATVAGKQLRLAELGGAELERQGFDAHLTTKRLLLTRAAAAALDRVLGLPVLQAGRSLGSVNGLGESSPVPIDFGMISVGWPETTFSKLESIGVQLGAWGASEWWSAGAETHFLFPLEPTMVAPDASAGILEGEPNDGVFMEIQAPAPRNMLLRAPRIDLAASALSARVSAMSNEDPGTTAAIATLDYSAATFQVRPEVGAFELMGIRAVANQFIADQLNARLGVPGTFQAGETLARVNITLHAPVRN